MITYDGLPLNRGGAHTLRVRGARKAWKLIDEFLTTCTQPTELPTVNLEVHEDGHHLRRRIQKLFGRSTTRPAAGRGELLWTLRNDQVDEALGFVDTAAFRSTDANACTAVGLVSEFKLLAPGTEEVLPGQDPGRYFHQEVSWQRVLGRSRVYARFAHRTSVSVFLSFPFDSPDRPFQECRAALESRLPFAFSREHWRIWRLNQRGDGYVGRRLSFGGAA